MASGGKVLLCVGVGLTAGLYWFRQYSSRQHRIYGKYSGKSRPPKQNNAVLLVTDIDHTLVSHKTNETELMALNKLWLEEQVPRGSVLCYNTGRSMEAYLQLVRNKPTMLRPDILITGDGTAIWWFDHSNPHPSEDADYESSMASTFDMQAVLKAFHCTEGKTFPLPNDAGEKQDFYRHSVVVEDAASATELCKELSKELKPDNYRLFWCSGREYLNGRYWLAASPRAGGKGNALQFVRNKLGFTTDQTVCAGDSGNDIDMFELQADTEIRGVVVCNAAHELLEFHEKNTDSARYRLHASHNGAAAIVEGLSHFGFSTLASAALGSL